jgi:hypothetical protein
MANKQSKIIKNKYGYLFDDKDINLTIREWETLDILAKNNIEHASALNLSKYMKKKSETDKQAENRFRSLIRQLRVRLRKTIPDIEFIINTKSRGYMLQNLEVINEFEQVEIIEPTEQSIKKSRTYKIELNEKTYNKLAKAAQKKKTDISTLLDNFINLVDAFTKLL